MSHEESVTPTPATVIDEELVEKYKDYNIFIGDIIRNPKFRKISEGTIPNLNIT